MDNFIKKFRILTPVEVSLVTMLVLMLICPSGTAVAEVTQEITYEYYDVEIPDNWRLDKAIKAATPLHSPIAGKMRTAQAEWKIKYSYQTSRESMDTCRLANYNVSVPCHITLPRFQSSDKAALKAFASYPERVKNHELGHCKIALDHGMQFEKQIKKYSSMDCDKLKERVSAARKKILEECRSAQKRYDADEYLINNNNRTKNIRDLSRDNIKRRREEGKRAEKNDTGRQSLKNLADRPPTEEVYRDADGVWRSRPKGEDLAEAANEAPPPQAAESGSGGFYKDQDGTWRNH